MRMSRLWPVLVICTGLAACADQPAPTQPSAGPEPPALVDGGRDAVRSARLERLARRFARALSDPGFRTEIKRALDASPFPEGKLYFQRTLARDGDRGYRLLAEASGEGLQDVLADANGAGVLELYLPVPAHRAAWAGDDQVLVATAVRDGDVPVGFDLRGRRQELDPRAPPSTPVLAVVPAEVDFDAPRLESATCTEDTCGSSSGGSVTVTPGMYLTRAEFVEEFESWLKGSPEFEIHIMGPSAPGETKVIASYQCIGEHAGAPYAWDMNSKTWTGNQLLFTNQQMDAFAATYGSAQPFSIMAYEDDDTACQIKTDSDRAAKLFAAIGPAVADWTAAIGKKTDIWTTAPRILKAAKSGYSLLTALYSFLTTGDDIIGVAVEDAASGRFHTGTNWTVFGNNVSTNGWLKLEMK